MIKKESDLSWVAVLYFVIGLFACRMKKDRPKET